MTQFFSTLGITVLHTLWQGAFLYGIYILITRKWLSGSQPLIRRNAVLVLLSVQLIAFFLTFYFSYTGESAKIFSSVETTGAFRLSHIVSLTAGWLYIGLAGYKVLEYLHGWYYQKRLLSDAGIAPALLRDFVYKTGKQLGIRRKIRVMVTNRLSVPVTFGWLKPVIIFPIAVVNNLSIREVEALLLHELLHIRFHDYVLNFVLVINDTLFFFNPFVRRLVAEARLEREVNCDLRVLQDQYSTVFYAETLLKTARLNLGLSKLGLSAISQKSELMERITRITGAPGNRKRGPLSFVLLALAICGVFVFSIQHTEDIRPVSKNLSEISPTSVYSFVQQAKSAPQTTIVEQKLPEKTAIAANRAAPKPKKQAEQPRERIPEKLQEYAAISNLPPAYSPMPVNAVEIPEKEMEIVEENPQTGEIITTGVKCYFIDGEWVVRPQWQTRLKKNSAADSLKTVDSIPVPFFEQQ